MVFFNFDSAVGMLFNSFEALLSINLVICTSMLSNQIANLIVHIIGTSIC